MPEKICNTSFSLVVFCIFFPNFYNCCQNNGVSLNVFFSFFFSFSWLIPICSAKLQEVCAHVTLTCSIFPHCITVFLSSLSLFSSRKQLLLQIFRTVKCLFFMTGTCVGACGKNAHVIFHCCSVTMANMWLLYFVFLSVCGY